ARHIDIVALGLMALSLASLEIALKQAPQDGWASVPVLGLMAISMVTVALFARRSLGAATPIVEQPTLGDRNVALGCLMRFLSCIRLYGSLYLMPVFLGFVRGHDSLEIGTIMLVTGITQLVTSPIAVRLELKLDDRLLTASGFLLFAVGLGLS